MASGETPLNDFGLLIAYLVPGATVLLGLSPFSGTLRVWLASTPANVPTIGGFLYLTVAALAAGMVVSAVRWVLIDTLHSYTGLPSPVLNFAKLGQNVEAFSLLIEIHYRHYQFYSNMFVATAIAYVSYRTTLDGILSIGWMDVGFVLLEIILFVTSRDTLRKYYTRGKQVLGGSRQ